MRVLLESLLWPLCRYATASTQKIGRLRRCLSIRQLAEKSIQDKLTRILVIAGACAGICYNALWYFPVLIVIGGVITIIWDVWLQQKIGKLRHKWESQRRRARNEGGDAEEVGISQSTPSAREMRPRQPEAIKRRVQAGSSTDRIVPVQEDADPSQSSRRSTYSPPTTDGQAHTIPIKLGIALIVGFFGTSLSHQANHPSNPTSIFHRRNGHAQHALNSPTPL